ncbi:MAG: hypothetical protein, partial [Olavius algarvensis Gamma 1 endosymbiont]
GYLGDLDRRGQEPDGARAAQNESLPGQRGAVPV